MQSETRNRSIKIRLTDDEFEALNRKKTRPELARWIREIALENEQKTQKKISKKNSDFPPEIARILAGMGNNLNQIAKQLNSAAKAGVIGNLEAVKAITTIAATERALNDLRAFLANRDKETEK